MRTALLFVVLLVAACAVGCEHRVQEARSREITPPTLSPALHAA
jgi:hypothetical protein